MKKIYRLKIVVFLVFVISVPASGLEFSKGEAQELAEKIISQSGVEGGLVVHAGCGDGSLTAALAGEGAWEGPWVVHGLEKDGKLVSAARRHILGLGRYGRISVESWRGKRLPYADNLVNLVVTSKSQGLDPAEVMRVLVPQGVLLVEDGGKWTRMAKPWPDEIDDWTHFLHGPDNNAVSRDKLVGPPRYIQWVGDPKFSRAHEQTASFSAAVTYRGRMFYIIDETPPVDIRLKSRWSLVARDAFNGIVLWKRPMQRWVNQLRRFRSGPASLPFRLVAADDQVFVTLDFEGPVHVLDAASGKIQKVIKGSEKTKQIIYREGYLLLLSDDEVNQMEKIDAARRRGKFLKHHCHVMKVDVSTGKTVWKRDIDELVFPCMALKNNQVLLQTPSRVMALGQETGKDNWSADFSIELPISGNKLKNSEMQWEAPTLVASEDVVLSADFKKVSAYDPRTGKELWSGKSTKGYNAPADVFLIDGLLWMGDKSSRRAYDPRTGKLRRTLPNKGGYMHARCYRNKATERFLLLGLMGVQMVDFDKGEVWMNDWIRGTCQYGVMPANGMLYIPPDSCACNMKTKLNGLYALASVRKPRSAGQKVLLEKGPAWQSLAKSSGGGGKGDEESTDWPTYRANPARSGLVNSVVPAGLQTGWSREIGGKLSSISAAAGRVYVAAVDRHTVYCLDAKTGQQLWKYTAGGRVDTPPTIYRDGVYFGSADGWVYALRAEDGELAWRFLGAPDDRRIFVRGQLESAWPVHGSVLIKDGKVMFAAGRSSYLEGGLRLCRLDAATGELLSESTVYSPEKDGKQPAEKGRDVRGLLNDILLGDGEDVYIRHCKLDFDKGSESQGGVHLFSPLGFLDDTWWHRAYWVLHNEFQSHWSGWWKVGNRVPSGRILSYDDKAIYGFARDRYAGGNTGQWRGGEKYQLYAYDRSKPLPPSPARVKKPAQPRVDRKGKPRKQAGKKKTPALKPLSYQWTSEVPLLATSLAVTKDAVFLAGPPDVFKAAGKTGAQALVLKDAEKALAAWQGSGGGVLYRARRSDGKKVSQVKLPAPPVFDGMAVAGGRIYLSLKNGRVLQMRQGTAAGEGK
ncbi:MAG: PQQ-binding-like beta-propeller repeat protein [Planctomycetota bacterium]|nr:PQQ-binding-like beta-propeller repeat protein [Planctomycetota bacterium]